MNSQDCRWVSTQKHISQDYTTALDLEHVYKGDKYSRPKRSSAESTSEGTDKIYGLNNAKVKTEDKNYCYTEQRFTDSSKDLSYEQEASNER